jgi:hypothetical protein
VVLACSTAVPGIGSLPKREPPPQHHRAPRCAGSAVFSRGAKIHPLKEPTALLLPDDHTPASTRMPSTMAGLRME